MSDPFRDYLVEQIDESLRAARRAQTRGTSRHTQHVVAIFAETTAALQAAVTEYDKHAAERENERKALEGLQGFDSANCGRCLLDVGDCDSVCTSLDGKRFRRLVRKLGILGGEG